MAPTDPVASRPAESPGTGSGEADQPAPPASGHEPLTADLQTRGPRVSTRALVYGVAVLALLVLVAAVVALIVLHQPRLAPLPVPSVSSIA